MPFHPLSEDQKWIFREHRASQEGQAQSTGMEGASGSELGGRGDVPRNAITMNRKSPVTEGEKQNCPEQVGVLVGSVLNQGVGSVSRSQGVGNGEAVVVGDKLYIYMIIYTYIYI